MSDGSKTWKNEAAFSVKLEGTSTDRNSKWQNRKMIRSLHNAIKNNDDDKFKTSLNELGDVSINFQYGGMTAVQLAVKLKRVGYCKTLIDHGGDVNTCTADDNSVLNTAAYLGLTEICDVLICNGATLDTTNSHGNTPLNTACYKGHVDIVVLLVKAGADINKKNLRGQTSLINATVNGNAEVVEYLLQHVPPVTESSPPSSSPSTTCTSGEPLCIDEQDNDRRTALYIAAEGNRTHILDALIKAGSDVNRSDQYGMTPLCVASKHGYSDIVDKLLASGAKCDQSDTKACTPLWEAVSGQHNTIVKALLLAGCNVNPIEHDNEQTPLHMALRIALTYYVGEQSKEIVELLVEHGCDLDVADKHSITPLYRTALAGHLELTQLFLDRGAKVSGLTDNKDTCLHAAVFGNNAQVISLLINNGLDVNQANVRNEIPLYTAVDNNADIKIIEILLSSGSEVNIRTADTLQTPLFAAVLHENVEVVKRLLYAEADVNITDSDGTTVLCIACQKGNEELVDVLLSQPTIDVNGGMQNIALHAAAQLCDGTAILEKLILVGAQVNKLNHKGESALFHAATQNLTDNAHLLLSHGANPRIHTRLKHGSLCCIHASNHDPHPHLLLDPLYAAVSNDNFDIFRRILMLTPRVPYNVLNVLKDIIFRTDHARLSNMSPRVLQMYAFIFSKVFIKPRSLRDECLTNIYFAVIPLTDANIDALPLPKALLNDIKNLRKQ